MASRGDLPFPDVPTPPPEFAFVTAKVVVVFMQPDIRVLRVTVCVAPTGGFLHLRILSALLKLHMEDPQTPPSRIYPIASELSPSPISQG